MCTYKLQPKLGIEKIEENLFWLHFKLCYIILSFFWNNTIIIKIGIKIGIIRTILICINVHGFKVSWERGQFGCLRYFEGIIIFIKLTPE